MVGWSGRYKSGDCQVMVKSQEVSELDIGGRETCSISFFLLCFHYCLCLD